MKRALITGITGQDGSYLAELLLGKGYQVHGIIRRSSSFNTARIDHLYEDPHEPDPRLVLHYGDLTDTGCLRSILDKARPDEVYNLGAQSHVAVSFEQPIYTANVVATGALAMLEAVKQYRDAGNPNVRYYQASSSEMFGSAPPPQNEATKLQPRSPYACAKVAAYHYTVNYRESYGLHASNGILFNHESPRRGETFVTRKITRAVGRMAYGLQDKLYLGNLDAKRDWGFAGDYMNAAWLMLQQDKPSDYVVATGESHTVREFVDAAFHYAGVDRTNRVHIDPRYYRPAEVNHLEGDARKARTILGWKPALGFDALVQVMVGSDMDVARREAAAE